MKGKFQLFAATFHASYLGLCFSLGRVSEFDVVWNVGFLGFNLYYAFKFNGWL